VSDDLIWDDTEFSVEIVEVLVQQIAFEFVFHRSCDKSTQAAVTNTALDALYESFFHAHRPLPNCHPTILPW